MINKKILGLIGLSAKAGKVDFGADSVEIQIKKRKSKLIIIAEDASNRTKEKFVNLSKINNIPYIVLGKIEEISNAIGKPNKAIISIKDSNLSNEIQKINNGGEDIG